MMKDHYSFSEIQITDITYHSVVITTSLSYTSQVTCSEFGFKLVRTDPETESDTVISSKSDPSIGELITTLSRLNANTKYVIQAYYLDEELGELYSDAIEFKTLAYSLPTVTTSEVSEITENSVSSGGTVTSDGGDTTTISGVCWNVSEDPLITDSMVESSKGTGEYVSSVSGLTCGTEYFIRAFATNSAGTAYGNQVRFVTDSCEAILPSVTTADITDITLSSAVFGGSVASGEDFPIISRGICWSTAPFPLIEADSVLATGNGNGDFSGTLEHLSCGTVYYLRAWATNSEGTAYGDQVSFSTEECITDTPAVTTMVISDISVNSALGGGEVTDDGGLTVTSRGICWSISQLPTVDSEGKATAGEGTGEFSGSLSDLYCGTTYFVRAWATNEKGTSYGNQLEFTTEGCSLPEITLTSISGITQTTAECSISVLNDGGDPEAEGGVCWSTVTNPTISDAYSGGGTGVGTFFSSITGLEPNTIYFVRAYVTNSEGTAYSEEMSFESKADPGLYSIMLITNSDLDDEQFNFLDKQGFQVSKFWPGEYGGRGSIASVGADTLDLLNSQDLLIIGFSPRSDDFDGPDKPVWNGLTAPLILNSPWIARSTRMNWIQSSSAFHQDEEGQLVFAVISDPSDPVFDGVSLLTGDSVAWSKSPHDFIPNDYPSNGTILATYQTNKPLLIRFEEGIEFYPGSGDMPSGPRTYFGMGDSNVYQMTGDISKVNTFSLTDDAKKVYLAEICRMLGIPVLDPVY